MRTSVVTMLVFVFLLPFHLSAQDSITVINRYIGKVSSRGSSLEAKLDKQSEKILVRLQKQEAKMKRKLAKIDSAAAANIFANAENKFSEFKKKSGTYIPKLDTLVTSLKFLKENPQFLTQSKEKINEALSKVTAVKDQFTKAESIKQFLKERRQYLKDQLSKYGFGKELKKLNKQVYYYSQQVADYKALLKDSKKAERKALELLSKTKLFKDFMRKNSQFASQFRMPVDPNDPSAQASVAGLQTRAQVNALIQNQLDAAGPGARQQFSQNIQEARAQLQQIKDKIGKLGGAGDGDMPDFKPNQQKTKSFLRRLEYGTNLQTQKATNFFPVTSDIGLTLGYKLNDKSIIGIGASYKVGLGRGWNHLRISHQGVGLRSYADIKLKGSFWLSGGFEQNYKAAFSEFYQLQDQNAWQKSGLLGLSKVISVKSKFFKKTKLQLLWDFLSYDQVPRTQPLVFRIGYGFK